MPSQTMRAMLSESTPANRRRKPRPAIRSFGEPNRAGLVVSNRPDVTPNNWRISRSSHPGSGVACCLLKSEWRTAAIRETRWSLHFADSSLGTDDIEPIARLRGGGGGGAPRWIDSGR